MRNESSPLRCLSIGSSDSSGGAGVQGDVKTFAALDAYGTTVVVGVTAQNTAGVRMRHTVPLDVVRAQLDAVLDDIGVDAVKIGTMWNGMVLDLIAEKIGGSRCPVVFDPVLVTASGSFLDDGQVDPAVVRERVFPVASVITPNLREARWLAGANDDVSAPDLAEALVAQGARAVLITDATPDIGGDWLFDGNRHHVIAGRRHTTGCEHGAGCLHSSVMAVLLGRGRTLVDAAHLARALAADAVLLGWSGIGRGTHPVDVGAAVAWTTEKVAG